MSTLHILSKPPSDNDCWRDCLTACSSGDTLLLIENGVYGATVRPAELPEGVTFLALQADLEARGLSNLPLSTKAIDDADFVNCCIENQQTVSWF